MDDATADVFLVWYLHYLLRPVFFGTKSKGFKLPHLHLIFCLLCFYAKNGFNKFFISLRYKIVSGSIQQLEYCRHLAQQLEHFYFLGRLFTTQILWAMLAARFFSLSRQYWWSVEILLSPELTNGGRQSRPHGAFIRNKSAASHHSGNHKLWKSEMVKTQFWTCFQGKKLHLREKSPCAIL